MAFENLEWEGRAWPAATIVGTARVIYKSADGSSRTGTGEVFDIDTTGRGREYELAGPSAFWRSFGELDCNNPDAVLGFLKRRGDPFSHLAPGIPIDTSQWSGLAGLLKAVSRAWSPLGPERDEIFPGISMLTGEANERMMAKALLASPLITDGLKYEPRLTSTERGRSGFYSNDLEIRIVAKSLAAYMVASALSHLASKASMAVCRTCGEWFDQQRKDANYCSASCRAIFHSNKKGKT